MVEYLEWDGTNLREVIDLIGLHPSAEKWTWAEYEQIVKDKGLKIFSQGIQTMVEVGDYILKFADGEYDAYSPDTWEVLCLKNPNLRDE